MKFEILQLCTPTKNGRKTRTKDSVSDAMRMSMAARKKNPSLAACTSLTPSTPASTRISVSSKPEPESNQSRDCHGRYYLLTLKILQSWQKSIYHHKSNRSQEHSAALSSEPTPNATERRKRACTRTLTTKSTDIVPARANPNPQPANVPHAHDSHRWHEPSTPASMPATNVPGKRSGRR